MVMNDPLANAMSNILNAERCSKRLAVIKPVSNTIKKILAMMNRQGYLGDMTEIKDSKGKVLKVNLLGSINECGVIKPRFSVKKGEYEKYEKRYLISRNIGHLAVSTSKGLMTHKEAKEKGLGGKLIAYFY